ncbi:MAG: hypothetical protein ACRDTI_10500 [Mycobacterium sp.]
MMQTLTYPRVSIDEETGRVDLLVDDEVVGYREPGWYEAVGSALGVRVTLDEWRTGPVQEWNSVMTVEDGDGTHRVRVTAIVRRGNSMVIECVDRPRIGLWRRVDMPALMAGVQHG